MCCPRCGGGLEEEKAEEQEQRRLATKRELEEETKDEQNNLDYEEAAKKTNRPDTVRIDLPKAPFNDPFVTATLDRLKVTTNEAMGFFGALVKTSVVDGERADLNKFVVSSSTLERQRIANREVAATLATLSLGLQVPVRQIGAGLGGRGNPGVRGAPLGGGQAA